MEIERKFLLNTIPTDLYDYPCHTIEQGYLCTSPVVRIRKEDNTYYLTYKGKGKMAREEYNLPLTAESYAHLREKIDGRLITKVRYLVPIHDDLTAEVDIFSSPQQGLHLAEVEFESIEAANGFVPPEWFGEDVTEDGRYHNSFMSGLK